ncbi:hypothetical protein KP509_18G065400 [Ceratopteris richardii]|uniref:DUF659 domain-containing protein n=1 Tax=Ceratopteris richardii TaxID=49495 RepID=A0A8T2SUZ9_CERRI|nr:hypothetical protein KP509_18G065400 [Ceratopteris richardii]
MWQDALIQIVIYGYILQDMQINVNLKLLKKQDCLELHLKWTQAFLACGIPFNVIHNHIFKDALMSTARKGFTMPGYNKMRIEYVDKVKKSTEAILKQKILDYVPMYGCTIALNVWTSCQKKPLINIMVICPRGNMILEAVDTSLKEKSSSFLVKVYEHAISRMGGLKNVTAIYEGITWVPCAAHTLNLLLKDIGRLSFIKQSLLDANHVVKFIREHQFSYSLFRTKSPNKALQIFCATRFAMAYILLNGLLEVKSALVEMIADRRWEAWLEKYSTYRVATSKCTCLIQSQNFWCNLKKIVGIIKPFVELLRMVDTDKFVIGKVYWTMSKAIQKVKDFNQFSLREKTQIVTLAEKRWMQMHTHLHGTTFVLDPTFQLNVQKSNKEVMANFKNTCPLLLPGEAVELQHIAMRVLSVVASSGSCERNWSAYDFLHSKQKNRLSVSRANDLVYVCNDGSDMEEIDDMVPVIDDDIKNEENDVAKCRAAFEEEDLHFLDYEILLDFKDDPNRYLHSLNDHPNLHVDEEYLVQKPFE